MRLGVAAPVRDRCGVADYARFLADAMPPEVEVTWLPYPEESRRERWLDLTRAAAGLDVVHLHFETSLFGSVKPLRNRFATLVRRIRAPMVVTLHGGLPGLVPRWRLPSRYRPRDLLRDLAYLPFFPVWERCQYGRADRWVAHAEEVARRVAGHVGANRVTVVPQPVPLVAHRWGLADDGEVRLVTPGFVKDAKGLEGLLEAVAGVPGARWTIAGGPRDAADDPVVAGIERRIEALGVRDRLRITGFLPRPSIDELLATATLAVFPHTWSEGSAAVAWAVGVGTPILASDLPVFRELQRAGAGVELAPVGDLAAWTVAIRRLVASPGRREAHSRDSATYAALHRYADVARRMADLFRSVAP